jgi:exopolysaccharide biosynthesis predicted pyruvyltransferase EpsI
MWSVNGILDRLKKSASTTVLNTFRADSERTNFVLPTDNLNVSDILAAGVENRDLAYSNAKYFLGFINDFESVTINRLHVAIGAALLGKYVKFYLNSYLKCRTVYDYSMRNFNNVEFMGAE